MMSLLEKIYDNPQRLIQALAASAFVFFLFLEIIYSWLARKKFFAWKDSSANLIMYTGSVLINIFWLPILFEIYTFVHQYAFFDLGSQWWLFEYPDWPWLWLSLIVLEDFCFYIFHRCSHKLRFFWASHVNHHSSQFFNLTVALRQTWTPFVAFIFWLPLIIIGYDPLMVLTAQFFSLFYQSLMHNQILGPMGALGWIFNTPSHHRVHHGANAEYLDKNFAGIFIIWDRLFKTFQKEQDPVRYGLTENIQSHNPLVIAFHEWLSLAKSLK